MLIGGKHLVLVYTDILQNDWIYEYDKKPRFVGGV
jgi:hypothetical protein